MRCVLQQKLPKDTVSPIGYNSRSLNDAEKQYDTTQEECPPIAWLVLLFGSYLDKNRFIICTHNDLLKWILDLSDSIGRLGQRRLCSSVFDFDKAYRAGAKRQSADASSCLTTINADTLPQENGLPLLAKDTSTTSSIMKIHFVDTDECRAIHHNTLVVATFMPTKNDHNSKPLYNHKFWKRSSPPYFAKSSLVALETHTQNSPSINTDFLARCSPLNGSIQTVGPQSLL